MTRGVAKTVRWPGREPGTMPEAERLRRCKSQKAAMNRPEVKALLSQKANASWANPAVRQRRVEGARAAWARRKQREGAGQ